MNVNKLWNITLYILGTIMMIICIICLLIATIQDWGKIGFMKACQSDYTEFQCYKKWEEK